MLWRAARYNARQYGRESKFAGRDGDSSSSEGNGDSFPLTISQHSTQTPKAWSVKGAEISPWQSSPSSFEPSLTPSSCNTANSQSAVSTTFSNLSAFERSCGQKEDEEGEGDSSIMLATREDMTWSFPFLLRRSQVACVHRLNSDNQHIKNKDQAQNVLLGSSWQEKRHTEANQPTRGKPKRCQWEDKPHGISGDVTPILKDDNSTGHSPVPKRKADITFKRTKSAQLGPESLRTSYFHHNALRRHNSTGNFSRVRLTRA